MAIASNLTTGPYTANGTQTAFAFDFTVVSGADVQVQIGGVVQSSSLYTVAVNAGGTGTVTFSVAPTNGSSILLVSAPDFAQETVFEVEGAYTLDQVNTTNRRDAVRTNWLAKVFAFVIPAGWQVASTRAGKYMAWDANGLPVPSVGTGNDSAFRTDAAASTGATLVGKAGGGTVQDFIDDQAFVTPLQFGAVGNGSTDDRASLALALQSGKPVDGLGLTYAVSGSLTPSSIVALRNINLVQIADKTSTNYRLLNLVGLSDFTLENIKLNLGSGITSLFNDDGAGGLYVGGTDSSTYAERFAVRNVRVTGNGCGTGIHIRHAKRFTISDCLVHDRISGSSPDPTNDSQNGIEFVNCANFTASNCVVYNLQSRLSGTPTTKWTRGITSVEVRDCVYVGCQTVATDQGFDFSGAYDAVNSYIGNRRFTVSGCIASNTVSNGFKFSNVTRDGLVSGCSVNNVGNWGFVFSPSAVALPGGLEKYNTQNIDVVGCKVTNVLGNGWSGTQSQGFRVMSNGLYPSYPRGIRFKDCHVLDSQDTPTTVDAFVSDSALLENGTTGYNTDVANYMVGCTSTNVTTHANAQIGPMLAVVTSSTTQSIPNAGASYTPIDWNVDLSDPCGLHNIASNNNAITIKTAGWYRIDAVIVFAANATGSRYGRLTASGAIIDRTLFTMPGSSVIDACIPLGTTAFFNTGVNIVAEVFQNSGGSLNVKSNESYLSVTRI